MAFSVILLCGFLLLKFILTQGNAQTPVFSPFSLHVVNLLGKEEHFLLVCLGGLLRTPSLNCKRNRHRVGCARRVILAYLYAAEPVGTIDIDDLTAASSGGNIPEHPDYSRGSLRPSPTRWRKQPTHHKNCDTTFAVPRNHLSHVLTAARLAFLKDHPRPIRQAALFSGSGVHFP